MDTNLVVRVIEGLILANALGPVSDHPSDTNRVYLKDVADAINQIEDDEDRESNRQRVKSRGLLKILHRDCQLQTRRVTDGVNEYRGRHEVLWDKEHIQALCERVAVEWKERGSVKRPVVIRFMQSD